MFYNSYEKILNTLIPVLIVANVFVYVFCFCFCFMFLVTLAPFAKILYNKIVVKINPAHPALLLLSIWPLLPSPSFLSLSLLLAHIIKFEIHLKKKVKNVTQLLLT